MSTGSGAHPSTRLEDRYRTSRWAYLTGASATESLALALGAAAAGGLTYGLSAFAGAAAGLGVLAGILTAGLWGATRILTTRLEVHRAVADARATLDQLQLGTRLRASETAFSAASDLILQVVREIRRRERPTVVELGAGLSTLVLARLARRGDLEARIVSVEHDPAYAGDLRRRLATEGLEEQVTLVVAPLRRVEVAGYAGPWYDSDALPSDLERIDVLVVDGPAKRAGEEIRYPAVPVLSRRLAPGALVLLDDCRRAAERRILRLWAARFPEAEMTLRPSAHGTGVLRWPDPRQHVPEGTCGSA